MSRGRALHTLLPLIAVGLFGGALWLLRGQLERYDLRDLGKDLAELSRARVGMAVLFTALSYTALTGYDLLAMDYIGRRLPLRRVAFTAFEGFAFSQNFAAGGLTGASIRHHLYTAWGLSSAEVGGVVVFNAVSFWLASLTLGGLAILFEPSALPAALRQHVALSRLVGCALLGVALAFFAVNAARRRPWRFRRWSFQPTGLRYAAGQLAIGALDWTLASGVIFVLLPPGTISYPAFLGTYFVAQILGMLSHVPGGLGVFETLFLSSLSSHAPVGTLLAVLVVYRVVYYLLPLVVAAMGLAVSELLHRRRLAAS